MNDDQEMAALRSKFSELAECHARELRAWLDRADVNHADLKRMVHNLAGTAGMLGFDDVAEAAVLANDQFNSGCVPSREELTRLLSALESTKSGPR